MENISRYYFTPNENHGLKNAFIKALLKTEAYFSTIDDLVKEIEALENTKK